MQGIKENLYIYLLQKKEQLSLDFASTIADAIIINHANNGVMQWPVPKAVYAVAILFGLIFLYQTISESSCCPRMKLDHRVFSILVC